MNNEVSYFTAEEIAASLGVNVASVYRWVESGKLQHSAIEDGVKKFCSQNLALFAEKYNISLRFLDRINERFITTVV